MKDQDGNSHKMWFHIFHHENPKGDIFLWEKKLLLGDPSSMEPESDKLLMSVSGIDSNQSLAGFELDTTLINQPLSMDFNG